jgi:hypothetical protein
MWRLPPLPPPAACTIRGNEAHRRSPPSDTRTARLTLGSDSPARFLHGCGLCLQPGKAVEDRGPSLPAGPRLACRRACIASCRAFNARAPLRWRRPPPTPRSPRSATSAAAPRPSQPTCPGRRPGQGSGSGRGRPARLTGPGPSLSGPRRSPTTPLATTCGPAADLRVGWPCPHRLQVADIAQRRLPSTVFWEPMVFDVEGTTESVSIHALLWCWWSTVQNAQGPEEGVTIFVEGYGLRDGRLWPIAHGTMAYGQTLPTMT